MSLTEQIKHETAGRPFSIHHTDVSPSAWSALYLHCHTELELFVLQKGELYVYIEDARIHMKSGDALFIPGGLTHYAVKVANDGEPCSFDAFVFMPSMIMDIIPPYLKSYINPTYYTSAAGICHIKKSQSQTEEVLGNIVGIMKYKNVPVKQCELLIRGRLLEIWQDLYNNCFSGLDISEKDSYAPGIIDKSLTLINDEYMYDHSLKELADACGLSTGHFCRTFKNITGLSPFKYLTRVRITKACELLTRTDKKIADISSACGFNNISYFNRTFLEVMKETPSSYRKNYITSFL